MGNTDRQSLIDKLRRGHHDQLLSAVLAGTVSAYAAACEVGIIRRREVLGTGSSNQTRRRNWKLSQVTGQPPPDEPEPDLPAAPISNPPKRPARRDVLDIRSPTKPAPTEPTEPKWKFDPKAIIG
jgi:hypothetical protein